MYNKFWNESFFPKQGRCATVIVSEPREGSQQGRKLPSYGAHKLLIKDDRTNGEHKIVRLPGHK